MVLAPSKFPTSVAQHRRRTSSSQTRSHIVTEGSEPPPPPSQHPNFLHILKTQAMVGHGIILIISLTILPQKSHSRGGHNAKDSNAAAFPRSLLNPKISRLSHTVSRLSPKYKVSQDCSDNRKVQSQRPWALGGGGPRLCAKRLFDHEAGSDDRELRPKRVRPGFLAAPQPRSG
jgi:hypothetical protein